jgi:hypothetical protein
LNADNRLLTAILDDLEKELVSGIPALLAMPRVGPRQLRRWFRGSLDRLTADAIASAQNDLSALADLDELETRSELQEVT